MIWMLIRAPKGQWCDYCGYRWTKQDPRGQRQAIWQIISHRAGKTITRSYCYECSMEVQTRHDGSLWAFKDQIDYARKAEQLDVQFK